MKHMSTWDLLDLADDIINLRDMASTHQRRESAMMKLAAIDTELLSRMPEYELVTVYDYIENNYWFRGHSVEFLPVGFEPYIPNEDEAWLFDALYGYIEGIPTVDEGRL